MLLGTQFPLFSLLTPPLPFGSEGYLTHTNVSEGHQVSFQLKGNRLCALGGLLPPAVTVVLSRDTTGQLLSKDCPVTEAWLTRAYHPETQPGTIERERRLRSGATAPHSQLSDLD